MNSYLELLRPVSIQGALEQKQMARQLARSFLALAHGTEQKSKKRGKVRDKHALMWGNRFNDFRDHLQLHHYEESS